MDRIDDAESVAITVKINLANLESEEWIAVYKPGLLQLVREKTLYQKKLVDLIGIDGLQELELELRKDKNAL